MGNKAISGYNKKDNTWCRDLSYVLFILVTFYTYKCPLRAGACTTLLNLIAGRCPFRI